MGKHVVAFAAFYVYFVYFITALSDEPIKKRIKTPFFQYFALTVSVHIF